MGITASHIQNLESPATIAATRKRKNELWEECTMTCGRQVSVFSDDCCVICSVLRGPAFWGEIDKRELRKKVQHQSQLGKGVSWGFGMVKAQEAHQEHDGRSCDKNQSLRSGRPCKLDNETPSATASLEVGCMNASSRSSVDLGGFSQVRPCSGPSLRSSHVECALDVDTFKTTQKTTTPGCENAMRDLSLKNKKDFLAV
eukprot:CAMPEP_0181293854 /NCGR_PEP_ID=MMETSP1101-20121128/3285_1 /TAXON_ID=46948 /ORGANISM="Rhodomonas abbreviata, Strain Caron Lab Isolate" /LENGTH=199 /DNA_ID=CAMNT_0023398465 /DNA_START=99 /DNA_END=696 /DNA_ORIENTATION=-